MATEPSSRPTHVPVSAPRRPALLAGAAGLCWAGVVGMLLAPALALAAPFAPVRMVFYLLIVAAALLTFLPVQRALMTPGLALEGTCGALLLFYALAFIPPPSGPIFFLPDLPVYVIFLGALFAFVSAAVLPAVILVGKRIFRRRARQYDLRRARRQAHEVGAIFVACGMLAALRILTPLSAILAALVIIVSEFLFLAYVETPA